MGKTFSGLYNAITFLCCTKHLLADRDLNWEAWHQTLGLLNAPIFVTKDLINARFSVATTVVVVVNPKKFLIE